MTSEQEAAFIKSRIEDKRELILIATVDGEHAENCSLMSIGSFRRYLHCCDIAIALYQKNCGAGIDEIMMKTFLQQQKNRV